MNTAKRISNQSIKNDKKKSGSDRSVRNNSKMIIMSAICAVIVFFLVIMVCWENLHPKLIFKINDKKVYLSDIMVDIYMSESTGEYMSAMYQQNYGTDYDYWAVENDDGMTNADIVKDSTIESVMQKYMMYDEAEANGYTLTDEDNTNIEQQASDAYDKLTSAVKNRTGISKDDMVNYYRMQTLADRYKSDWIDSFDIDDAAITANVSPVDYRQYDIQYYYIPYTTTDDQGTSIPMDDAQKAAAKAELEASYADISGLSDFTTYISDTSSQTATPAPDASPTPVPGPTAPEGTNIKYTTKSFIETDTADTIGFDDALVAQIKAMDNESISEGVVEDANGCYIIKMVNNNSTERYESECESLITEEENRVFDEEIDNLEVEKYYIEFNDAEWDKVEFGKVTTGK